MKSRPKISIARRQDINKGRDEKCMTKTMTPQELLKIPKAKERSTCGIANWLDGQVLIGELPSNEQEFEQIIAMGINKIVCLCERHELRLANRFDYFIALNLERYKHVELFHKPIKDNTVTTTDQESVDIVQWMIEKSTVPNNKIYIHCQAGIGRSGVIASVYLGLKYHVSANTAMRFVSKARLDRENLKMPHLQSPAIPRQKIQVYRILKQHLQKK